LERQKRLEKRMMIKDRASRGIIGKRRLRGDDSEDVYGDEEGTYGDEGGQGKVK